jgi:hypothetical protein
VAVRFVALAGVIVLLSACAIHQNIDPVEDETIKEMCVVWNPDVRDGFLIALTDAIEENGIATRVVEESEADDCTYRVTYTATWSWDLAIYLVYANIRVWEGKEQIGESEYNASGGSGRIFDKFVDAEEKVYELVDGLLGG